MNNSPDFNLGQNGSKYTRFIPKKGQPPEIIVKKTNFPIIKAFKHEIVSYFRSHIYIKGDVKETLDRALSKKTEDLPIGNIRESNFPEAHSEVKPKVKSPENIAPATPFVRGAIKKSAPVKEPIIHSPQTPTAPEDQSKAESSEMVPGISKPIARTVAGLVDQGSTLTGEQADELLLNKPNGSFLIRNDEEDPSKFLVFKDHKGVIHQSRISLEKDQTFDEFISRHNTILTKPILANNLIQKKSEAVNLICQKVFTKINEPKRADLKAGIESEVAKIKRGGSHTFEMEGHTFVLRRDIITKAIEVARVAEFMKEGGFGKVYGVEGMNIDSNWVIKFSKDSQEARSDLLNEISILNLLNPNGDQVGLQVPPHTVINYMKGSDAQIGFMTYRYAGDGVKLCKIPNDYLNETSDKYECSIQVLKGLRTLKNNNVYHGDIKPANMFFNVDDQSKVHLVLADFGSASTSKTLEEIFKAQLLDPESNPEDIIQLLGHCTMPYTSNSVHIALIDKMEKVRELHATNPMSDAAMTEYFNKELMPEMSRNDAFALALSLYDIWTGKIPPFMAFKKGSAIPSGFGETDIDSKIEQIHLDLMNAGAPPNITDAIKKLIVDGLVHS
ncbi:MAG: hypothetical protein H0U49_04325 [Parachlamydiaceae bacterium]|nr:hypothetical protein [Parachlamydiaceae bacterium]